MTLPEIAVFPDPPALFAAAAEEICTALSNALRSRNQATLVLTGGSTPGPLYRLLSGEPWRNRVDWRRLHFFWGDERCVPPGHRDSNYGMASRTLLAGIATPEQNVHRMLGELADPSEAARRYEQEIQGLLGNADPPSFDLVLLGMGDDGHTASLFPGTRWDGSRLVVANYVPRLGAFRITMTPRLLNAADRVIFLAEGKSKAGALAGVLSEAPGEYPAAQIRPASGNLKWMVDAAAASLLPPSGGGGTPR